MRKIHPYELYPGLCSRYDLRELKDRFRLIDFIVVDLDECVFPGFSQTYLGILVALRLLTNPERFFDIKFLLSLFKGGIFITLIKIKSVFNIKTSNLELLNKYEQIMKGIPLSYFEWAAQKIPALSFPYCFDTLKVLAKKAPLGIISLGTDIVLAQYEKTLNKESKIISFFSSNHLVFEDYNTRKVFVGYDRSRFYWSGIQKEEILRYKMKEFKKNFPLIIGHNIDDIPMVQLAKQKNGLGIGFNPSLKDFKFFDIVVRKRSWAPLNRLINNLMKEE